MTDPAILLKALQRIASLRPAGDIATAKNTRAIVQQMERIALEAVGQAPAPPLHTITWSVKRMREMKSALQECETYFEGRADAEFFPDSPDPCGNREMQLLVEVQQAIAGFPREIAA